MTTQNPDHRKIDDLMQQNANLRDELETALQKLTEEQNKNRDLRHELSQALRGARQ